MRCSDPEPNLGGKKKKKSILVANLKDSGWNLHIFSFTLLF